MLKREEKQQRSLKLIKRILLKFSIFILLVSTYFSISIRLTYRFYMMFSFLTYAFAGFYIILGFIKLAEKKDKTKSLIIIEAISIIFLAAVFLYYKNFIDSRNLFMLKTSNQNIAVRQIIKNSLEADKVSKKYDSAFKTSRYKENTIYFTADFEPAVKLVQAYLDKAKQDNLRLFGQIDIGELKVKFDYEEGVFKKRNPSFIDYTGLYSRKEKTAYVFIEDCYSNALALNLKSSYLRQILLHEYTHHVFYEFLSSNQIPEDKIPAWFVEGVSEYIGFEGDSGYDPEKMADFDELRTRKQWVNYNNKGYSVYEQSHYAVRQLILTKGEGVVMDILMKVQNDDFNTAFEKVSGVSLKDYEKALKKDAKDGWKKYNKLVSPNYTWVFYGDEKTKGLEKYVKMNPNNIDALLDLAELYKMSGLVDKAKATLSYAVEISPKSFLAWHRLALIHEEMNNFDAAVEAFKKVVSVSENDAPAYINLAQALLLQEVNEAAAAAQKAKESDKSSFIKKQAQAILYYQSSLKAGKPYEGCLQLIKSDTLNDDNVKKALIEKLLNEYPHIKNSARYELEKIRGSLN
jgi:tetratricopeptide (TPR) repeat protein